VNKSVFALERNLQDYICSHPEAIPVEDKRLLVVARELQTESGAIDAFAVDTDGDLYVVETKLYKNPDKRTVVAQARHADFKDLVSTFDQTAATQWKMPFRDKLAEFFAFEEADADLLIDAMRRNLSDGRLKFVILMDELEDRLKDLITYVNENSQFDIYAVQIEYYRHEEYEIVIPKLYGTEVRKEVGGAAQANCGLGISSKIGSMNAGQKKLKRRSTSSIGLEQTISRSTGARASAVVLSSATIRNDFSLLQ
jgi:hypothetical protein